MRCLSPKDNNFYICLLQKTTMAAYLQVDNLTKSYGDRVLFNKISFHINQGDKVALVAPNGSGKTFLLDVLAGKESPEGEGTIKFMSGIQVAYLEQDPSYDPELTVLEQVRSADKKVMQTLTAYKQALESEDKKRLEKAINDMDRLDGWNYDQKIERILTHLQFGAVDRKMGTLSGGEIKKVALAGMLIQEAPFMILDEPTNHLDIEVIEYLEDYMSATQATLFMVTHDRYFLDRVCNTVYELENGELFTYRGNYSLFLEKREERLANRAAETDKARNLYRRELQWIRSTPCARTGKSKSRLESFGKLKERIGPAGNTHAMEINAGIARLGTKIIHARNLSFTYGEEPLLKDFTYNFSRNEKIGIVGGNGVGKTTFLRLLAGELEPLSGTLQHGTTVRFGFYRQEGISFNPGDTVFDVVHEIAEVVALADGSKVTAASFLSRFLFPPSMHQVKVERLSGGEKRRLYLLTILMRNPNFLILDEPTNDLDILTLNVLEEYLENFKGCLLIVSHDRYFMDKLADHLFAFEGQGIVQDYPGKCSDYYRSRAAAAPTPAPASRPAAHPGAGAAASRSGGSIPVQTPAPASRPAAHPGAGAAASRSGGSIPVQTPAPIPVQTPAPTPVQTVKKLTYRQRKRLEELEAEIQALEEEKFRLESLLSDPERPLSQITEASVRMGEILVRLELDWEELLGLEDQRKS
ncbi:MAG TPA: ABC-F family ATP-binding cassette domain-containing protein [Bacteroidales bacterium]|nr:ABC-F family ATP-binding cassette domain-containing protein [Bacteroidales bacterium]